MYRILIVDDEKMIREGIKNGMAWKKLGIDSAVATGTGKGAISELRKEKYDIVLTDICMEGMSGLELVSEIRKIQPEARIIIMTAYDRFDFAQQSLRLHVNDFLLKPIDEDVLAEVITKQINDLKEASLQKHIQPVRNMMEHAQMQREFGQVVRGSENTMQLKEYLNLNGYQTDRPCEVVFLHMIEENNSQWEKDREFLWISLRQVIMEIVDNEDVGLTFYSKEDMAQMVLYADENDEPLEVIDNLRSVIFSEFGTRAQVRCSSVCTGIIHFMECYSEAEQLMKESIGSYKTVMKPMQTEKRDELFSSIFAEVKGEMLANLGNYQRICRVFDVFVADTQAYHLSVTNIRAKCFELASSLYYAYVTESGEMTGNRLSEMISALSLADGNEACEYTRNFIMSLLGQVEETEHDVVNQARNYINLHLSEELSVSVLAEKYFMSVSYFSRLFKKVTGTGCNEYIVQKRMRVAQDLLATTPLPTGEVAIKAGYSDKNYFSLAFRRKTGMTPTEYREKNSIHRAQSD